jgi:hypothetical protein
MSDEIYFVVDLISLILAGAILVFGASRALTFRRVLANGVFRDRALWTAVLLVLWIVPNDTELLGYTASSSYPVPVLGILFIPTVVIAFALIIAIVAFIDYNIRVGKELDFFHRDSLLWERTRILVYVATPLTFVLSGPINGLGLPLVLGYAALALLVCGIRVQEKLMRKYLTYAGFGLIILVVGTILIPSPGPPLGVIYDAAMIGGSFFLSLSSRSLSPLNRIQDET